MTRPVIIGNAQGFWGDSPDAPARLVAAEPRLDYLTLDYLAEVSMSILALKRQRDAGAGFVPDVLDVFRSLAPLWRDGARFRLITNAGGLNPHGCARACGELLEQAGCPTKRIAVVSGDDVSALIRRSSHSGTVTSRFDTGSSRFDNLETGAPLGTVLDRLVSANAYLGARPITKALELGADVVITGRVADPSLTVAPAVRHFGWRWDDFDRLAGATVAGHLIECGAQLTGGIATNWLDVPDVANIGYPVVEIEEDGSCVVTKPAGTGGRVNEQTVKEQLLYEIGDPDNYLSPDVTVSLLSLRIAEEGENRVRLSGAKGRPPPETYKVSATYRAGFRAQGLLTIFGEDAVAKARRSGEIILQRVRDAGYLLEQTRIECLGAGDSVGGVLAAAGETDQLETVLRIAVADSRKEAVQRFTRELAALITCGPPGTTGYAEGRPRVHPVFGFWPCLIDRASVEPVVQIVEPEARSLPDQQDRHAVL